ncbi:phenylacetate-CoA oxygenase subunit PaaJ [Xenorhabdus nematophila]|uniref:Subunit of multicomponent oxygenase, phenylacetic acid degradation n=1 Tax=Xenorhabdus nematophila (strain ATCC 19061 / DSM 3370 / CCUG 14189 / LMG 1036 / NCIMB 9965 / AN6) TaxID=406817 RepID=D3VFX5_XENNA|nr:1,2-phenylacetyl-CoA epoxidase subunit PaaD [Xenorhabdus nematophila]CEE94279.1 putative subunit of multicomponent oxygenase, phenylacetic acid degradation [Xenorhabdus nematophila str. Anatoliense]CEF29855.1 putative subunit of multicomponent oxygenase, phenylacetic acid degradation [Xenorhabdus nematophila str. Websteri]AYA41700.1 phenylacetate-CoA oxygenase subunit PaaJ [Xenorhabdus nematophila]KHD29090.1 phenylacetic acid degradation protein [Xenorhabdus nematophila]MBA0020437.1 phenyla
MEQQLKTLQQPEIHQIWQCLHHIADPELPALSITDLGMIRAVTPLSSGWRVTFTPTYSGCPATEFLLNEIRQTLTKAGFAPVYIDVSLTPAWTTDWMSADARQRLRESGIAPPQGLACEKPTDAESITCPRCGSHETEKISEFGSTACKALYRCQQCLEPFDYFKCI